MAKLRIRVFGVALLIVAWVMPSIVASDSGPDAGTGADAGNDVASALRLPGPGTFAAAATEKDEDWYRLSSSSSTPRCVSMTVDSSLRGQAGLTLASSDRSRTVRQGLRDGDGVLGLAAPDMSHALGQVRRTGSGSDVKPYEFGLQVMALPDSLSGDAFTLADAGAVTSAAIDAPAGCFAGVIGDTVLSDTVDLFRVLIQTNDTIVYSLVGSGVSAVVLDAAGNKVGPTISSGELASVTPEAGGDYYLSISTTSSTSSTYLVGLVVGPPDPGSSCRPMCLL